MQEDEKKNALDNSVVRAKEQELEDQEAVLLQKAESIKHAKEKLESERKLESDKRATELMEMEAERVRMQGEHEAMRLLLETDRLKIDEEKNRISVRSQEIEQQRAELAEREKAVTEHETSIKNCDLVCDKTYYISDCHSKDPSLINFMDVSCENKECDTGNPLQKGYGGPRGSHKDANISHLSTESQKLAPGAYHHNPGPRLESHTEQAFAKTDSYIYTDSGHKQLPLQTVYRKKDPIYISRTYIDGKLTDTKTSDQNPMSHSHQPHHTTHKTDSHYQGSLSGYANSPQKYSDGKPTTGHQSDLGPNTGENKLLQYYESGHLEGNQKLATSDYLENNYTDEPEQPNPNHDTSKPVQMKSRSLQDSLAPISEASMESSMTVDLE